MRPRLSRLLPGRRASALVVLVPEAESVVGRWRALHDPSARHGMPAHVTALFPFIAPGAIDDESLNALAAVAASVPAFSFRLSRVGRFPRTTYLEPEPSEPFVALSEALVARWPEHQPYRGAFATVVPHLTVANGDGVPDLEAALEPDLPIECCARELSLMAEGRDRRWQERARFPLGAGGPPRS